MGAPPGPGDQPIVGEFHHALAVQGAFLMLVGAILFVGWNQLRSMQYRRAVQRGEQFPPPAAPESVEPPARRFLRIAFGLLWLFDGLLQFQPGMPAGLVSQVVQPSATTSPSWVQHLVNSAATVWTNHPAAAAASAVWIQLGIGLLLLVGPRGWWSRGAGVVSVGWGLVVWVLGNAFGGIFAPGLTILFGAPGAVLFYVTAGVLIALPDAVWAGRRLGQAILRSVGVLLLGFAVLQAWPGRGFWQGRIGTAPGSLAAMVDQMASTPQPHPLSSLVSSFASFDEAHGWGVNLFTVVAMAVVGTLLVYGAGRGRRILHPTMVVLGILCIVDWILIEDFGFWGGLGTDPNSMLPLFFVTWSGYLAVTRSAERDVSSVGLAGSVPEPRSATVAVALREPAPAVEPAPVAEPAAVAVAAGGEQDNGAVTTRGSVPERRSWWENVDTRRAGRVAIALGALAVLLVGVAPMSAAVARGGADPLIAEATDGPPTVTDGPAPGFRLIDQFGNVVSLADLRGSTVVLTFLDPVCTTDCPVIAQELRITDTLLGAEAARVRFVAVVANPIYRTVQVVNAFDRQEGLESIANWRFLTGSLAQLRAVWNNYGVEVVSDPGGGMIDHSDVVYVIDAQGRLRRVVDADPGAATSSTKSSFSGILADQVNQVIDR